eukprot:gb/GECH01001852.1/.p1 GENE.gb/GECH01001852.1/~~gb/GECH01001852.1/.p1  ORF type:complete len:170 (+),score=40.58 gb/GECH01001852.1/:1-510(+)
MGKKSKKSIKNKTQEKVEIEDNTESNEPLNENQSASESQNNKTEKDKNSDDSTKDNKSKEKPKPRFTSGEIMGAKENRAVMIKFYITSFLMFALPLATYFFVHNQLEGRVTRDQNLIWSGVASIVMVQVVIAFYIISAFYEPGYNSRLGEPTTTPDSSSNQNNSKMKKE